jgi:excisionase family DNA binding protein
MMGNEEMSGFLRRMTELMEEQSRWAAIGAKSVLNSKEAAQYLGVTVDRVRHMVMDREIVCYRNSKGRVSFRKSDIESYLASKRFGTKEEDEAAADTYTAARRHNPKAKLGDIAGRQSERLKNVM